MIGKQPEEEWKPFRFEGYKLMRNRYAISSLGRLASYRKDLFVDGKILKGSSTGGYKTFNTHDKSGSKTLYVHKEVARRFVKKNGRREKFVIHLNHDKTDNRSSNLRWVSTAEWVEHHRDSPAWQAARLRRRGRTQGRKLTEKQVMAIKRELSAKKRKLNNRELAEKFDVSEMTIYRIKRGESWPEVYGQVRKGR